MSSGMNSTPYFGYDKNILPPWIADCCTCIPFYSRKIAHVSLPSGLGVFCFHVSHRYNTSWVWTHQNLGIYLAYGLYDTLNELNCSTAIFWSVLTAAVTDIIITIIMTWKLSNCRTGIKDTDDILTMVCSNILTTEMLYSWFFDQADQKNHRNRYRGASNPKMRSYLRLLIKCASPDCNRPDCGYCCLSHLAVSDLAGTFS